ncbi:two-component regulator propeller domain-containing protein [Aureisphaera galaxeae]|uniref:ligand-binding sensor domain-containing protein n=1 Tax=Aureisphaera galaxeae TaxID=1538023 RepID=UPI00234FDFBC|nr:sensor histidine kinase [Aureisphaera galaxeae]MDC8004927.1 two-component regulator propeller domain-containing protein [Aureisphaera galaxeae]
MNRRLFIFLCSVMLSWSVFAQFYEVTRYADHNGLPSRIVLDIAQDDLGYLWIAGNNGLYKFDGQKFHGYYARLGDTTGLRDNKIQTLVTASDGRVWIATPQGLHVLENEEITFIALEPEREGKIDYVINILEDSSHNIWVSTYQGLYFISKGNDIPKRILLPDEVAHEDKAIWSVTEDSKHRIWVCRADSPPLIAEKGSLTFNKLPWEAGEDVDLVNLNPFKYIEFDAETILISAGTGLLKGSWKDDSTLFVEKFKAHDGTIASPHFLYNTAIDKEGFIWNATWRNYFTKYKLEDGFLIEQEVITTNGLPGMSSFSRSIFEDSQGNIWIANSNGLYKLSKNVGKMYTFPPVHISNCLDNISMYALAEDDGGHLWINTPTILYRINKQDILDNKCPTNFLEFKNEHFEQARDLLIDSNNRLWISGKGGVSVAQLDENYEPGPFAHYTAANGLPNTISTGIIEEDSNTFWLGNYIRLLKVTLPDGDFNNLQFKAYDASFDRDDALVNSYTFQVQKDSKGQLWVGTFAGLSRMLSEEGEGTFQNYTSSFGDRTRISNNSIKKIFRDRKDRLWIGTQTGLNLYEEESDRFRQFGLNDGLPSEYILGIQEDSKGALWIATTRGVFKGIYNESMQSFVHIEYFTMGDGLADNITNRNSIYIDSDDHVFIGSSGGLSVLNPSAEAMIARSFNLGLTTLESITKKDQGFVSIKDRIKDGTIELSHRENSIKLSYAVLDFTGPSHNQYRHKMLPTSEDWIETGNDAALTYYNLPPGEYTLLLDGSNNQGIWSEVPLELKIHVLPPIWKTKWAYALYVLLLLGTVWWIYRLRIRKKMQELQQETRLERALIREREQLRNENAADFHDELGSKVTKISMFLTLAERTLQENKDPSNWFGKMRENIKDLSGSFRDLLWVIDPQKDSLSDAILRLKDFGEELFSNTDTHYTTQGYSEALHEIQLDPQTKKQIVLIFKEAMHNCAKYSDCTVVELTVETEEGYSSLRLKDNGKGFNVHRQSKGRGLTNMKNRSDKIGGNLSIVSGEEGTVVVLHRIPHLRDENGDK